MLKYERDVQVQPMHQIRVSVHSTRVTMHVFKSSGRGGIHPLAQSGTGLGTGMGSTTCGGIPAQPLQLNNSNISFTRPL